MPRAKRGSKSSPEVPPPIVEIQISASAERRRALKDALAAAVADEPGPWRIRVSSTLVYHSPNVGAWWLKVTLASAGKTLTVLLPDNQTPALIAQTVASAARGQVFTVVCSSCGRIRLEGSWQRREDVKAHACLTHGICPDCAEKLYPDRRRRIRERQKKPRSA